MHLEVIESWGVRAGDDEDFPPFDNAVAKCSNCESPFVLYREWDEGGEEPPWSQRYPPLGRTFQWEVPQTVRDAFHEGQKCMENGLWTAATIMARRTMEAVSHEHGYLERTLHSNLEKMRNDKVIDTRLFEWSRLVKDLGNEGAHDVQRTLTRDDATEALGFAEALVDYLYVIRQRYDRVMKQRQARAQNQGAVPSAPVTSTTT